MSTAVKDVRQQPVPVWKGSKECSGFSKHKFNFKEILHNFVLQEKLAANEHILRWLWPEPDWVGMPAAAIEFSFQFLFLQKIK